MTSRFFTALKFLSQFGLRPLALFALYKFGLLTGHYKRMESRRTETSQLSSAQLFTLPSREQLFQILGKDGKAVLLKEADEILAGKARIFAESVSI